MVKNSDTKLINTSQSVNEAFDMALKLYPSVYLMGQGIDDPIGQYGTTLGLQSKYNKERVFDTPISENGLMGIAIGSAMTGMKPIYIHNRPDFLLLAMDQLVNHASKWHFMFGGKFSVPLIIWTVIGRGWGLGPQHSQALQGLFMHIPGLRLVMPSTPSDSKGLILASLKENNPVIIMEHKWLLNQKSSVPSNYFEVPIGQGIVRKTGKDITIAGTSYMIVEAEKAAKELLTIGIDAEVIDLRSLKPLDETIIRKSVKKTGRLILVDDGWKFGGVSAEIAATIQEKCFKHLKAPIVRVSCIDVPTPSCKALEDTFYPNINDIKKAVITTLKYK